MRLIFKIKKKPGKFAFMRFYTRENKDKIHDLTSTHFQLNYCIASRKHVGKVNLIVTATVNKSQKNKH